MGPDARSGQNYKRKLGLAWGSAGTGCHENERGEKIQACLANFKDIPFLESATSPEGIASFAESRDMQEMFVPNLLTFGKLTMRKLQGNWAELVHLLGK